ncbi:MAG: hypothetical protein IJ874_05445 [Ruminococcus sp.]|nr:hypothetical protein [Ruminococcus sp.]
MNEADFREWQRGQEVKPKVISDTLSRLRRIEKELSCDIDEEFRADGCERLLGAFLNKGDNEEMKKYPDARLPIGKYYMSTYRLALRKYIEFMESNK